MVSLQDCRTACLQLYYAELSFCGGGPEIRCRRLMIGFSYPALRRICFANGVFPPRAPHRLADPGASFLDVQAPGAVQLIAELSSGLPEPDVALPEDVPAPGAFVPAGVPPEGHSDGPRVGQALHA